MLRIDWDFLGELSTFTYSNIDFRNFMSIAESAIRIGSTFGRWRIQSIDPHRAIRYNLSEAPWKLKALSDLCSPLKRPYCISSTDSSGYCRPDGVQIDPARQHSKRAKRLDYATASTEKRCKRAERDPHRLGQVAALNYPRGPTPYIL